MFGLPSLFAGVAVVALLVGGASGWMVRDWKCDSAQLRSQVEAANIRIKLLLTREEAAKAAAAKDEEFRRVAELRMKELTERLNELKITNANRVCLDPADADRLRDSFPPLPKSRPKGRSR